MTATSSPDHVDVAIARGAPRAAAAYGVAVASDGPVPRALGLSRAALAELGFAGKLGQALVVPRA